MTDETKQQQWELPEPQSTSRNLGPLLWGFFLIGLMLIVFVIIPGLVEGPHGSKVDRVRGDLRNMATALEAYAVDWGGYPLSPAENDATGEDERPVFSSGAMEFALHPLTTPIAYLGTLPRNPFPLDAEGYSFYKYYCAGDRWILWSPGPDGDADLTPEKLERLYDKKQKAFSPEIRWCEYDPTNGTFSNGDISSVSINDSLVTD